MGNEYIKRNDVMKKLNYIFRAYGVSSQMKEVYKSAIARLPYVVKGELETTLDSATDVQPVKCGRWIDIYEWAEMHDSRPSGIGVDYWCSECEKAQEKKSNYCPHCGAKMDGKAVYTENNK